MPRAADTFIDNVAEYLRWIDQNVFWPHVTGTPALGSTEGARGLEVEQRRITEMQPQHAVSALHKSVRWYEFLEANDRFTAAGHGRQAAEMRRRLHHSSHLVAALMYQAIGNEVWVAQQRVHTGRAGTHLDDVVSTSVRVTSDLILEAAIDTVDSWRALRATSATTMSPAREVIALRDILIRTLTTERT